MDAGPLGDVPIPSAVLGSSSETSPGLVAHATMFRRSEERTIRASVLMLEMLRTARGRRKPHERASVRSARIDAECVEEYVRVGRLEGAAPRFGVRDDG